jgi:hypothetical protein
MIVISFLPTHHRIEVFRIKIAIVDIVAARAERLNRPSVQDSAEALLAGVGVKNQYAHAPPLSIMR